MKPILNGLSNTKVKILCRFPSEPGLAGIVKIILIRARARERERCQALGESVKLGHDLSAHRRAGAGSGSAETRHLLAARRRGGGGVGGGRRLLDDDKRQRYGERDVRQFHVRRAGLDDRGHGIVRGPLSDFGFAE